MAEVSGRILGTPAVLIGQGAFLVANAALGALEAHLGSSPMVLIADLSDGAPFSQHGPYQAGTGDYGTWDATTAFGGLTKRVFVAYDGAQAVQATQLALKHAGSGEPGPVVVLLHSSALSGRVGPDSRPVLYHTASYTNNPKPRADPEAVTAASRDLASANRAVIVAGNGVRAGRAYEALQHLAEILEAPVATTASGKGVFPETHQLALGTIGNFGLEAAHSVVGEADVILAVGTKLGPTDTANEHPSLINPARQVIIQIDVESLNIAWTFPVRHKLIGDCAEVLGQLAMAVQELGGSRGDGFQRVAAAHREFHSFDALEASGQEPAIFPQQIIAELQRALPVDAVVACDAGENRIFMSHYFRTGAAGGFIQPASIGGMGYAIPAAMAAKLLFPERTCVAVCGDGGFAMSMNGLLTAIEEDIPIGVVIFNNSALGWVLHGQSNRGHQATASRFADFDYAAIARAMGCEAFRVDRPEQLSAAFRAALACRQPAVVDVVTSLNESYERVTTRLIQRAPKTTPDGP
jgi:acetolactate synthase-1/2/3 large subunit